MCNFLIFVYCWHVERLGENERDLERADETWRCAMGTREKAVAPATELGCGCMVVDVDSRLFRLSSLRRLILLALVSLAFGVLRLLDARFNVAISNRNVPICVDYKKFIQILDVFAVKRALIAPK